jgi:hypothetical protein
MAPEIRAFVRAANLTDPRAAPIDLTAEGPPWRKRGFAGFSRRHLHFRARANARYILLV